MCGKWELQKREGLVPSQVSGRRAPPSCRSNGETSGKKTAPFKRNGCTPAAVVLLVEPV